jgi:hypothetical protein
MNRPDGMDRDVGALLGLDPVAFVAELAPVKRPPRQPTLVWIGASMAVALVAGAGFGLLRVSTDRSAAEHEVEAAPQAQTAEKPKAMSLQVVKAGKPRAARREAVQAVDFDPAAPANGVAPIALAFAESAGPAPADHASGPKPLEIAAFARLSDKEIDPNASPPPAAAPDPPAEPSANAGAGEAVDAAAALLPK